MGGVPDQSKVMAPGEAVKSFDFRWAAEQMDGRDRAGATRDALFGVARVEREGLRIDIRHNRDAPCGEDHGGSCDEREVGDDDLIAGLEDSPVSDVKSCCAGADSDRKARADVTSEPRLKVLDDGAGA
jgi:hypothetical protein